MTRGAAGFLDELEPSSIQEARGRPAQSAMAVILVIFPRVVFPTQPRFGLEKAVDEFPSLAEIRRDRYLFGGSVPHPLLEPAVARVVLWVPIRQIGPLPARAENPQDGVQN